MATVIFEFNGAKSYIQCNVQDTMGQIYQKFGIKVEKDISKLLFIHNGKEIKNKDSTFQQEANELDRESNLMNVIVYEKNEPNEEIKIIKSKEIICPVCNENILINFNDYKINLINCKKGHNKTNISFGDFQNTQNINISKIICDICKDNNKGRTHQNLFYRCNSCLKNICPLCRVKHDKEHKIIDYSLKDYKCTKDNLDYTNYCNQCNENFCIKCAKDHNNHNFISLQELFPYEDNLTNNELRQKINKLNDNIKNIIKILESVKNNIEQFYIIYNEYIQNYNNASNFNYEVLKNINEFIRYKNVIINDINQIINTDNQNFKFNYIMNIYNKINYINNINSNVNSEGPKMNIIFTDKKGLKRNLVLNHGTSIDQALKQYLNVVGKPELINNPKVLFLFNINKLEFGNNTPIEKYFNCMNPRINVNEF